MPLLRYPLIALAIFALSFAAAADELVPAGSIWRYLDDGTNQGAAWRTTSFNDSSWATGAAELGYGDGDEATIVSYGPNASNKFVTTYFRYAFEVDDPNTYTSLVLSTLRDDGAVVYLNGVEVWRSDNMPAGPIGYGTYASWALGTPEEATFYDAQLAASLLVDGQNVLAVEVHQADATSTDVSFDLRLEGLTSYAVTRGPYLQLGTPTSMIVRWRTNGATDSRVRYGTAPDALNAIVDDAALTTEHQIALTGLTPSTTYYYSVGSSTETLAGDATHTFVTAPPPSTAIPTRVWILGDSGAANSFAMGVRDAYLAFPGSAETNLWLMLGDNAYETGTDAEYQAAVFDMYPTMLRRSVLWPTIGNHDTAHQTTPPPTLPYFAMFSLPTAGEAGGVASGTEKYYSFDYGNIHFICLDSMSSARAPAAPMLTWLENDLAATTQQWIIAFWHHPPYSKGSHDSDWETPLIEMRTNALPILEDYGVDLVLSGHSHSYERSYLIDSHYGASTSFISSMKKDGGSGRPEETGPYSKPTSGMGPHEGAVYAVAGSSSIISGGALDHPAMFISMNNYGSMVLDVNGGRLDAKFLRENGVVADSFTIVKGPLPCQYTVTPSSFDFPAAGGTGEVTVTTTAECTWSSSSNVEWITMTPGSTTFTVAANDGAQRDGSVTVAGTIIPIAQGAAACTYEVSPTSFTIPAAGGTREVTVTTGSWCTWSSSSNVEWITMAPGSTSFTVAANTGAQRNGSVTVAGTIISITQDVADAPATPTGVNAQAISSNAIRVTWNSIANATGYEILRASSGSAFAPIGMSATAMFDDTTVTPGAAYRYAVRAVNGSGVSPNSASDLATATIFTDGSLVAGTHVKTAHLTERRAAVNAVRALAGLAPYSFSGSSKILATHINELRLALDQALAVLGYATGGYTDVVSAGTPIRAVHFREISDRVQ